MKQPPNTPTKGDLCKLRGRDRFGMVAKINRSGKPICTVIWNDNPSTPMLCHFFELEKIAANP